MSSNLLPITCSDGTPFVIESLWELYATAKAEPTLANIDHLGEKLNQACDNYLHIPDAEYMAQLAQLWIHKTQLQLTCTSYMYIPGASLARFFRTAQHRDVVERLLLDENNIPVLGYALLRSANKAKALHFDITTNEVAFVANKVLNRPIDETELTNMSSLTDSLYGAGAWAIYRPDVDEDDDIPMYLFIEKIPPLGILQGKGFKLVNTQIVCPGDFV